MKWIALVVMLVGCSEGPHGEPEPVVTGCTTVEDIDAFSPTVSGTLGGADVNGRWYIEGAGTLSSASVWIERDGSQATLDHDQVFDASDTRLSGHAMLLNEDRTYDHFATEITNLRSDDTMRREYISCTAAGCTRCTSRMIRASWYNHEAEADHLALLGELGGGPSWAPGFALNVRVAGTLAYLIRRDGLHIIETADPAHPVELGFYTRITKGSRNDVKLVDAGARHYAIIADTPLDVVDVTEPRAPALVAQIPESAHTLFTETRDGKTLAYLGGLDGTCPVYDVTDPAHPVLLGRFDARSRYFVHDLSVKDGIAYLNAWEQGFMVVDFTTPAAPRLVGTWADTPIHASHSNWTAFAGGRHIALHGDEGYDARLDVVDVDPASPAFMTSIASWQTHHSVSIHNIMMLGTKAYFTYYQDGVRVMDLSDPLHPTELGHYDTWDPQSPTSTSFFFEGAIGLDVDPVRKLVFVADDPRGLVILADQTP